MKIFIEIPTWLGDCVMITPTIENICRKYPTAKLTIFGSQIATEVFKLHPNLEKIIIDDSKNNGFRYFNIYKLVKNLDNFDLALSFRRNFTTKFLLFFIKSLNKNHYQRIGKIRHQVVRYNDFINSSLKISNSAGSLKIYLDSQKTTNKTTNKKILGINPGATYGSAKRWYADKFAEVINALASDFDEVIIFGGVGEVDIVADIEKDLNIDNYKNLAGKLSIRELFDAIESLDLFITGDSGPMHLAASFGIKTVAIFGPTKDNETSQWQNSSSIIVKKDFACQPCMQRVCPLKENNHQCMKMITAADVIDFAKRQF